MSAPREGSAAGAPVLLLTGRPGIGKTTVIQRVIDALAGRPMCGFVTEEVRSAAGGRVGFQAVTLDGRRTLIAHVEFTGPARVGRYGVDLAALDELAEQALAEHREVRLYVIDEIGKMECLSRRFVAAVRRLLAAGRPILATVGERGGGLIAEVKRHPGAELLRVTRDNRDRLAEQIAGRLGGPSRG